MNKKPGLGTGGVARILDANLNRANEGLRVVEEYARFVLDARGLCARLKNSRHELYAAATGLQKALPGLLREFRDTPGDVGTEINLLSESRRHDPADVAIASCKRVQQALRVIEEYGKTIMPECGVKFQELRYEIYAIENLVGGDHARRSRLRQAMLYVLVTGSLASTDALGACREAVAGGADIIQMREKEMEDREFHELALRMREICLDAGVLFLVNDRPHIAHLVQADGIHSGQGDLPVHLSRRIVGHDRIIGRSTSAPEFADAAMRDGADYIGVGPVYPTNTKQHRAAVGLEYVRYAAGNVRLPFFCIGSINRETIGAVIDAGARAVAVCTAIIGARDIAAEAAWFKNRLKQAGSGNG